MNWPLLASLARSCVRERDFAPVMRPSRFPRPFYSASPARKRAIEDRDAIEDRNGEEDGARLAGERQAGGEIVVETDIADARAELPCPPAALAERERMVRNDGGIA